MKLVRLWFYTSLSEPQLRLEKLFSSWRKALCLSFCLSLALLSVSALANSPTLTAQADRTTIGASDTFYLVVRYDEQVSDTPDFSPLQTDFEILNRSQSNQYRSINGVSNSFTEWKLLLAPKRSGDLNIPALRYNGTQSNSITLKVIAESKVSSDQLAPIFAELEVDFTQAYVQQQITVKRRLLSSVNVRQYEFSSLEFDNALVKLTNQTTFQRQINGTSYGVAEETFAVFPQNSGSLVIPAQQATLRVSDAYGRARIKRVSSESKTITVMPQPDSYTGDHWLPAEDIELTQAWSDSSRQFTVGEPVTRTLTLTARGLTSTQLPELRIEGVNGLKLYPEQPQENDKVSGDTIVSERIETIAVMPTQAGTYTLPAVQLKWWDTRKDRETRVVLPPQTITVKPSSNSNARPPELDPTLMPPAVDDHQINDGTSNSDESAVPNNGTKGTSGIWFWLTIALTLTNLLTISVLLYFRNRYRYWQQQSQRHNNQTTPHNRASQASDNNEKAAFKQLQTSCRSDNLQAIRQDVIHWAQKFYQDQSIHSIEDIVRHISASDISADSHHLSAAFQALDSALFSSSGDQTVHGEQLLQTVSTLRQQSTVSRSTSSDSSLPSLNPRS